MKIPLLIAFSFPFFLYAQQEEWDVYMAKYEKGPGSVMLNMALKRIAPLKDLPFVLVTGVTFRECTSNGLPTTTEFNNLYKISDSVKSTIDRSTKNQLAGTFTYQCQRLDYYYLADTAGLREKLGRMYSARFRTYTPYTNIKADRDWKFYLDFLYPNEETRESIENEKVIVKLQQAGDKLDKPRQVDHWIYFANEKDRNCFTTYLLQHKFSIESTEKTDHARSPFSLHASRVDKCDLASMNKLTMELKQEAKKCNGTYDAWETSVIK